MHHVLLANHPDEFRVTNRPDGHLRQVMEVKEEEIKKLYGGGDWHMAYICLYKRVPTVLGTDSTRY